MFSVMIGSGDIEIRECSFEELELDWRRFEEEGVVRWPYLTYDWQAIWWQHYKHRAKRLLLLGIYERGHLEAIAPLWLGEIRLKGWLKLFDRISFIGAREIDYADVIIRREGKNCFQAIADYVMEKYSGAVLYLCDIRPESLPHYERAIEGYAVIIEKGFTYPYLKLPRDINDFWKSLGRSTRKDLRLKINRLGRLPDFRIERGSGPSLADHLFRLHYRRWRMNPDEPHLRLLEQYERDLIQAFQRNGIMKFIALFAGDRCLGTILCYDYQGVRYYHKMGYDPAYGRYSPGNVLLYLSIEEAIEQNLKEYDLLRGNEEYKWHFASDSRVAYNLIIAKSRLKSQLFRRLR